MPFEAVSSQPLLVNRTCLEMGCILQRVLVPKSFYIFTALAYPLLAWTFLASSVLFFMLAKRWIISRENMSLTPDVFSLFCRIQTTIACFSAFLGYTNDSRRLYDHLPFIFLGLINAIMLALCYVFVDYKTVSDRRKRKGILAVLVGLPLACLTLIGICIFGINANFPLQLSWGFPGELQLSSNLKLSFLFVAGFLGGQCVFWMTVMGIAKVVMNVSRRYWRGEPLIPSIVTKKEEDMVAIIERIVLEDSSV